MSKSEQRDEVAVTIRLPRPTAERLSEVAKESERTVTGEVRFAVNTHLAAREASGPAA
jgi:predicted DNA-binding protein